MWCKQNGVCRCWWCQQVFGDNVEELDDVDPSGGRVRVFARGGNISSMGDNSDIDCASCLGSAADKNAAAVSRAWRTYSSSTQISTIKTI